MGEPKILFFKVWADWGEKIEPLDMESRGELFTALLEYIKSGAAPALSTNAKYLFPTFKSMIDYDVTKYEATASAHREAGKKGGRPKKTEQTVSKKPNGYSDNQKVFMKTKPNQTKADKDQEHDNDQYISLPLPPSRGDDTAESAKSDLIDSAALSDTVKSKLREWLAYKGKSAYKSASVKALVTRIDKAVQAHGDAAVCDLIDESLANGYKGIIFDRLDRGKPKAAQTDDTHDSFDTDDFWNLAVKRGKGEADMGFT